MTVGRRHLLRHKYTVIQHQTRERCSYEMRETKGTQETLGICGILGILGTRETREIQGTRATL